MKWSLILLFSFSTMVWALDDEESFTSYESIVSELKASTEQMKPAPIVEDPWDQVGIYAGLGLATSSISAEVPGLPPSSGLLKGLQAHFGIDLFTKYLRAEGAFRTFAQEPLSGSAYGSLKEFELRGVFVPAPYGKNLIRLGTGLSARYLDIKSRGVAARKTYEATTPASVFFLGLERKIAQNIAFGPDISYRSALIEETFDKIAWDLCLKLNANF